MGDSYHLTKFHHGRPARQANCHPERRHQARGMCASCYVKWRLERNPDAQARAKEASKQALPAWHRLKKYGLTEEAYQTLLAEHGGKCAICGELRKLVIDHCHATGVVRGLLCSPCNLGLGYFQDRGDLLARAKAYLTP